MILPTHLAQRAAAQMYREFGMRRFEPVVSLLTLVRVHRSRNRAAVVAAGAVVRAARILAAPVTNCSLDSSTPDFRSAASSKHFSASMAGLCARSTSTGTNVGGIAANL
jgi:hypothetical protein